MSNLITLEGVVGKEVTYLTDDIYEPLSNILYSTYSTLLILPNKDSIVITGYYWFGHPFDIKKSSNIGILEESYNRKLPVLVKGKYFTNKGKDILFIRKVKFMVGALSLTSPKNEIGGLSLTEEEKKEK